MILDTRYGKVHSFHRTWTADSVLAQSAEGLDEAISTAGMLAR